MNFDQITQEHALALQKHLAQRYGAFVVEHDNSVALAMLRAGLKALLGLAGLASAVDPAVDAVLGERSFAIGPWVWLNPGARQDPRYRLRAAVHEIKHVQQTWRDGLAAGYLYLRYEERKARLEAEAYLCEVAVEHHFTGRLPASLDGACAELDGPLYRFGPEGRAHVRTLVEQKLTAIAQGLTVDPVAKEAIRFLEALGYRPVGA
jgi:hypothetical protein